MSIRNIAKFSFKAVVLGGVALGTYKGIMIYRKTALADPKQVTHVETIPDAFRQSKSVSGIVNVLQHPAATDSLLYTLDVPQHVSDKELLARFVKGFFDGQTLSLERMILQAVRLNLVGFKSK